MSSNPLLLKPWVKHVVGLSSKMVRSPNVVLNLIIQCGVENKHAVSPGLKSNQKSILDYLLNVVLT